MQKALSKMPVGIKYSMLDPNCDASYCASKFRYGSKYVNTSAPFLHFFLRNTRMMNQDDYYSFIELLLNSTPGTFFR